MQLSSNFSVIDAFGGAAYFEVSDTAFVRFDVPAGGYLFRTNYSLSRNPGRGRGFARYGTMEKIMAERRSFDPAFFLQTGRTYRNELGEKDALKQATGPYLYEHDFIPRRTAFGKRPRTFSSDSPGAGLFSFSGDSNPVGALSNAACLHSRRRSVIIMT